MKETELKTFHEIYAKASAMKAEGQNDCAMKLFQELINDPRKIEAAADYQLFGSAYFHLGDIARQQDEHDKAEDYFEKCLYFYPEHAKAQEYMRQIQRNCDQEEELEALISPMMRIWNKRLKQIYIERWKQWWRTQEKYYPETVSKYCRFKTRDKLFFYIANTYIHDDPICYLEFGVHTGSSIKWWLKNNNHKDSMFYGFDSFRGLPEFWGRFPKGRFDTQGIAPAVDDERCKFIVGYFQDTLHDFLKTFNGKYKKIIHLDADLYSATMFVLANMAPFLKSGDILMFDEFLGAVDEFKAFLDFQAAFGMKCKLIAGTQDKLRGAFEVL